MEIVLKSKQNKQSERQHINIQIDIETHFLMEGMYNKLSKWWDIYIKKMLIIEDLVKRVSLTSFPIYNPNGVQE